MANLSSQESFGESVGLFHTNPVINRLRNVCETDETDCCTYRGIGRKLVFFLAMVAVGIALNLVLKLAGGAEAAQNLKELKIEASGLQLLMMGVCGVIFLVVPFLSFLIRRTIPVTGSLYCIATGYVLSFLGGTFGGEYAGPLMLALLITVVLVLAMGLLYFSGKVQVDARFRVVMLALFATVILGGIVVFLLALIPATRPFVAALQTNMLLSVGGAVVMALIGCMFLMVDFDTIKRAVDQHLPREYEWYAAYGLVFSVIWLYFKILELILRFTKKSKS